MARHRILLADADAALLSAYQEYLTAEGFSVSTARTGADCVEWLADCTPDVLIVDLELTTGWGEGLLGMKWDGDDRPWIRVIVLTSHENEDAYSRFASFPVSAWHVKPLGPAMLAQRIRELLYSPAASDVFVTEWAQSNGVHTGNEKAMVSDSPF